MVCVCELRIREPITPTNLGLRVQRFFNASSSSSSDYEGMVLVIQILTSSDPFLLFWGEDQSTYVMVTEWLFRPLTKVSLRAWVE